MTNPVTVNDLDVYYRGTFSYVFTVYDIDDAVVDISGYDVVLQIKEEYDEPGGVVGAILYEASTDLGTITITGPTGKVNLLIPDEDVEEWDFSEAVYDCFVISPTGNAYPISRGKVRVYPSATDTTP